MTETNVQMGSRMIGNISVGDMQVPRLGFGAMRITGDGIWGDPPDPAAARDLLRRVVDLGIRFIDTADAYGPEVSERLIAEALHPYPAGLVIATKGGIVRPDRSSWVPDGRPEHLRAACEASLRRLRLDRIDLYQLHTVDARVPLEDSVGELARLQQQGKVRHVGLSNVTASQLESARRIVKVVSVQNRYNVADRTSQEVLAVCERDGLAFIPWSPLVQSQRDRGSPQRAALEAWARTRDLSIHQAALAWLLLKSPAMLPIPGTSTMPHVEANLAAALAARSLQREMSA
ncbi:MAG TPA: aldo/keto reductase, partial [Steroidobacteraceae bacterium]|nr:aldo/keto reductase [Steroidobacteraceae bacterium]